MPIGGFVVNAQPELVDEVAGQLNDIDDVEVHGFDESGNIVAVIDSVTSDVMEAQVKNIEALEPVLTVGVAYFHAEDEVEKIERGELVIENPFGRKKKY
ncbi:MAG: chaperone NapD [Thermodesulfobacteriota bacterium]|nr:chaperone NapD [Thermodesulfobacteriota bacterium]